MADKLIAFYPHRHNKDGSYDSICLTCFATVSTARTEPELVAHDIKHICEPWNISQRLFDRTLLAKLKLKES
jgi:hypothetical protein